MLDTLDNHRDNLNKSRYFNRLFLQEIGEYRVHLFLDMEGSMRVNKEIYNISSGSFLLTAPEDHYSITSKKELKSQKYFFITFQITEQDSILNHFISSILLKNIFNVNPGIRFTFDELYGKLKSL